jgi:hypothetical protein
MAKKRGLNGLAKNSILLLGGVAALEAFVLYPARKKQFNAKTKSEYDKAIANGYAPAEAQSITMAMSAPRMFGLFNV